MSNAIMNNTVMSPIDNNEFIEMSDLTGFRKSEKFRIKTKAIMIRTIIKVTIKRTAIKLKIYFKLLVKETRRSRFCLSSSNVICLYDVNIHEAKKTLTIKFKTKAMIRYSKKYGPKEITGSEV